MITTDLADWVQRGILQHRKQLEPTSVSITQKEMMRHENRMFPQGTDVLSPNSETPRGLDSKFAGYFHITSLTCRKTGHFLQDQCWANIVSLHFCILRMIPAGELKLSSYLLILSNYSDSHSLPVFA